MQAYLAIPDFDFSAIDSEWKAVTGGYFLYRSASTADTLSMQLISSGATGTVTFLKSNIVDTSETIQQIKDKFVTLNNSEDSAMVFTVGTANEIQETNDIYRSAYIGMFVEVTAGTVKFYDKLK